MKLYSACLIWMAAVASQAQGIRVIETPLGPDGLEILQAVASPPEGMNARELGAWQLLCAGMLDGTDDFVREDIFGFGGQAGVAPRAIWSNDLLRLQFAAPKGGESTIVRLLESVLTKPAITDERLVTLRTRLSAQFADDWSAALRGDRGDYTLPAEFVRRFSRRAFRPETLTLVGTPGVTRALKGRFDDWRPERIGADFRVSNLSRFRGPDRAKVAVLHAPVLKPTTGEAAKMLAMVAIGGGKTSLLHQVAREQEGWSYRQEALLLPQRSGWKPTLILAGADPIPPRDVLLEALKARVSTLASPDLDRLRLLSETAFAGTNPLTPFWLSNDSAYLGSSLDRTAWTALCAHWGVANQSPETIQADMRRVSLLELKEALTELLESFR